MIKSEEDLLNLQNIVTLLYIGSLIISIYITNNDKYNKKKINELSIFNRFFVVILTLLYLYISYKNREIAKEKKDNLILYDLQLVASLISLLSTLIVLYVVLISNGENYSIITGIENPDL